MRAAGRNDRRPGRPIRIICSSACARSIRNKLSGIGRGRDSKDVRGKGLGVRGRSVNPKDAFLEEVRTCSKEKFQLGDTFPRY
jgi:hypothetical protein